MAHGLDEQRTRRSVLLLAISALGAATAHALGRPAGVRAANGDPVLAGQEVTATATTTIRNDVAGAAVLAAKADGATSHAIRGVVGGLNGIGVYGEADGDSAAGVSGFSNIGIGVQGATNGGLGVYGISQATTAVRADSASLSKPAVLGRGHGGAAGLVGFSGDALTPVPDGRLDTGVYGYAVGYPPRPATNAVGVFGRSTVGTGVYAQADTNGTALHAQGRVTFSRSGRLTITAGHASVTKSVAGLTSSSLVFAVVQSGSGGVWVRKVSPYSGKFTVRLNKSVARSTVIAWFALG